MDCKNHSTKMTDHSQLAEIRMSSDFSRQQDGNKPLPRPSPWLRKPFWVVEQEIERSSQGGSGGHQLARHLTLFDLVSVGVGGTVGTGIFVLSGSIAHQYAGSLTPLSFMVSGVAASLSGVCYAELSGRIPSAGSTYAYAYTCIGEVIAVISAACLTLEYGVSGAAVARSWGDKVAVWCVEELHWDRAADFLEPGGVNLMAGFISALSITLLLGGVRESKQVTNFFTVTKMILVIIMAVGGLCLFRSDNLRAPLTPNGFAGVARGATSAFFGFLGYDEVCCIAGEAINPHRDMPRAVLLTLASVTVLYIIAAFALTGMQHYSDISPTSGFPVAFSDRGIDWLSQLVSVGEIFTLPVVVLISLMAQPRLQHAMAQDGLLHSIFGQLDCNGNLRWGTLASGTAMTLIAMFVPFSYLDDFISVGILVAFSITNSCLILMRCQSPVDKPKYLEKHLVAHNALCLLTGLLLVHAVDYPLGSLCSLISFLLTISVMVSMAMQCPKQRTFGGQTRGSNDGSTTGKSSMNESDYFKTPFVPMLPCLGIFANWYLVAQLEPFGLFLLFSYVGLVTVAYFTCCVKHSVGNSHGWAQQENDNLLSVELSPSIVSNTNTIT